MLAPVLLLVALFQYCQASARQVAKVDTRCPVNYGLVADMNDCSGFLICQAGRVRKIRKCSFGLMWDMKIKTCNYKASVTCGNRPHAPGASLSPCYVSDIRVSLRVENQQQTPFFTLQTTVVAPRQSLENFLLMAAGRDANFRFEAEEVDSFGNFVTAINGVRADRFRLTTWIPLDRYSRQITSSIRDFAPQDGDTISFKFFSFAENCTGSSCNQIQSRLLRP